MALARRHHQLIRFVALLTAGVSVSYMASRSTVRADVTQEGLSRLTPGTIELIRGISEERPVTVHAFVSREVPREFVTVRSRLLNILREMQGRGGPGLEVRIVEPQAHSVEAEEALETFDIAPTQLADRSGGRVRALDVFMGVAFVAGPRVQVVPFVDRGMSVEYELNRALRVAVQDERKVVGILRTDATIMGNFDLQQRRRQPPWQVVEELRKQYEVRSLNPTVEIPEDIDVLIVPQLASCTEEELATIRKYVDAGRPALLSVDPVPLFDMRLAPSEPKPSAQQNNMFGGGGGPPPEDKGDVEGFLRSIGARWDPDKVVYDTVNPYPILQHLPGQIVFSTESGGTEFDSDDPALEGLSEVVFMFAGELTAAPGSEDRFHPLLRTSPRSGLHTFDELYDRHPLFGLTPRPNPGPGAPITGRRHVLAARLDTDVDGTGSSAPSEGEADEDGAEAEAGPTRRNVLLLADVDLFGDQFFVLASRGGDLDGDGLDDVQFDNIPFLLNAIDDLAGDDRFLELRRRRPTYRPLTTVDERTKAARVARQEEIERANAEADAEIDKAKERLESAVASLRERTDLDETTKDVSLASIEAAENRRLQAKTAEIERQKERKVAKIDNEHGREIDKIQNELRLAAVLIPPLPALFLGVVIFARKRRRESDTIPEKRRRGRGTQTKGGVA